MCGIIGYKGKAPTKKYLVNAIKLLMARGYDSFGIDINSSIKKIIHPNEEDISGIIDSFDTELNGICIAHTRWATHGKISIENTHPISNNIFHVVMNGQISNFEELKKTFQIKDLQTECDAELISYLFNQFYDTSSSKNLTEISQKVISTLEGDFSFALHYKDSVILFKRGNPLYLGISSDSYYFSSDPTISSSINNNISKTYSLQDNELLILDESFDSNQLNTQENTLKNPYFESLFSTYSHSHYTLQEILRQGNFQLMNTIGNINAITKLRNEIDNCIAIGEGTSFHLAKQLEETIQLKTHSLEPVAFYSSQINNHFLKIMTEKSIILYSQSGETKDIIDVVKKIKKLNYSNTIYLITNNPNSTLSTLVDFVIDLKSGLEIGVASTITYTNALFINFLLTKETFSKTKDFITISKLIQKHLELNNELILSIDKQFEVSDISRGFSLSNQTNSFVLESSLKLSELTEILVMPSNFNSLKHGMYSCIEKYKTLVLVDEHASSNLISQLVCRDAIVVGFNCKYIPYSFNIEEIKCYETDTDNFIHSLLKIILIQKLAYDIAVLKHLNPDKPKNLAKSVTVES